MLVALDIGTDKIEAIVGEITDDGFTIVGFGQAPSNGLKKGVVVNIESTTYAIQRAVQEAELMADCQIHSVYTAISGAHVRSYNSTGVVAIRDGEVVPGDIERVLDAARAMAIPADQKILHVIPQEYILDHEEGIRDPVGMSGVRLEARVHLVTGTVSASQNITKCIERCGLKVDGLALASLASSHAVLTEDERDLGVCLIDIGAGTTDVAVWVNGAIEHTAVFAIAGDQVTNDIAIALQTPTQYAEEIKIKYACALRSMTDPAHSLEVVGVGDRPPRRLSRQTLASVVEPRYEELFEIVLDNLRRLGVESRIPTGIVLTGGSARMEGVVQLAEEVFHLPVRLGAPGGIEGLGNVLVNPLHATGVGILRLAQTGMPDASAPLQDNTPWWLRIKKRITGWF